MNFEQLGITTKKELIAFLKQCSNLGIKDIKIGDFTVSFHETQPGQVVNDRVLITKKISRKIHRVADAIEREAQEQKTKLLQDEENATSLIENPEEFERAEIEGLSDGATDTTGDEE